MSNINLATEGISKKESKPLGKGLVFSISFLVLLVIIYVGLVAANKLISSKISSVQAERSIEYNKFLAGKSAEVLDFKNRGDIAKELIAQDKSMANVLGQIEASTLPSVYLISLGYDKDKKTISLAGLSDNFQLVAEQILSFKQNNYFSKVLPGRSFIDATNNNKINFSIDLIIK